jgi:hypothetical protein
VSRADLPLSNGLASNADIDRLPNRVYVYRRLRGARDRNVPCRVEQRFDLDCGATHLDSIEHSSGPRDGDGQEYAQDADRDGKLDNAEGVSHLSFRRVDWLNTI